MSSLQFDIQHWLSWRDGEPGQEAVKNVPAMLRRRLSPAGRAAASVILPLTQACGALPMVYCSRHGEVSRTVGLLEDLANGEPLSPTAFSLSVHNAIAGILSIHCNNQHSISAIAAGSNDVVPALLEALGLSRGEPVLLVFCDAPVPGIYQAHLAPGDSGSLYALGLVVRSGAGGWNLSVAQKPETCENSSLFAQPQSRGLMEFLQTDNNNLELPYNGNRWRLSRPA